MQLITFVLADISVFVAVISFPVHYIHSCDVHAACLGAVCGGVRGSPVSFGGRVRAHLGAAQAPADHSVQPEPFDMISQFSWLRCLSLCMISQLRCPHGLYDIMQSAISC